MNFHVVIHNLFIFTENVLCQFEPTYQDNICLYSMKPMAWSGGKSLSRFPFIILHQIRNLKFFFFYGMQEQ